VISVYDPIAAERAQPRAISFAEAAILAVVGTVVTDLPGVDDTIAAGRQAAIRAAGIGFVAVLRNAQVAFLARVANAIAAVVDVLSGLRAAIAADNEKAQQEDQDAPHVCPYDSL
jgi:hypothetical protein